ncbi:MAG: hypothetical protein HC815_17205 [Richelia sp. RM1_1_1]|nr:hypothetical protein [Richelia sp. RM1_1_1]
MKNALSEIKRLGKSKPKKPKQLDIREFLNMVILFTYSVILEESNFKQFCEMEEVSEEVAGKLKDFAQTKSFISYVTSPVFAITANPEYTLQIPTREKAKDESEKFGLVILKNLVEDLETQSVESVCIKAEEIMQTFLEMNDAQIADEISQLFGDIPI